MVSKAEEKLQRVRLEYKHAYAALLSSDGSAEQELKRAYLESHNAYILQLRATNATTERYQFHCLPGLLGEIAEVYEDICGLTCKCVAGISEAAAERAGEQAKRYQAVVKEAQAISSTNDLQVRCRTLPVEETLSKSRAAYPPTTSFIVFFLTLAALSLCAHCVIRIGRFVICIYVGGNASGRKIRKNNRTITKPITMIILLLITIIITTIIAFTFIKVITFHWICDVDDIQTRLYARQEINAILLLRRVFFSRN